MAVESFAVTFTNGETREVVRRPIHMVRAEAIESTPGATLTFVYASLWAACGEVGDRDDFERWLETVDGFKVVKVVEADPPDPGEPGSPD